tara:strand:+ start:144 stop:434 length:291 start_codon:yes stop_codon:yes gene_type:complete
MIKLKNIITEKKELDAKTIQAVVKMTDSNAHNYARLELAQALRNKKLQKVYQALIVLHQHTGQMNDLITVRHTLDKELKYQLQKTYGNFDEIWGSL